MSSTRNAESIGARRRSLRRIGDALPQETVEKLYRSVGSTAPKKRRPPRRKSRGNN